MHVDSLSKRTSGFSALLTRVLLLGVSLGGPLPELVAFPGTTMRWAQESSAETSAENNRESEVLGRGSVGQMVRIDAVVIAGSEVEVLPIDDATDVVIRIRKVWPHGTDRRYDLDVQGRVAGRHDLAEFLRRKDGSSLEISSLAFEVNDLLTGGVAEPHATPQGKLAPVGGYGRGALVVAAGWVLAGIALIVWIFRRPRDVAGAVRVQRTLAEQLEEVLQRVLAGSSDRKDWARVESLLLAHWRRKLNLEGVSSAEALQRLRRDPRAGELLRMLDEALHAPEPRSAVDWSALLEPYRATESVSAERLAAEERTR